MKVVLRTEVSGGRKSAPATTIKLGLKPEEEEEDKVLPLLASRRSVLFLFFLYTFNLQTLIKTLLKLLYNTTTTIPLGAILHVCHEAIT